MDKGSTNPQRDLTLPLYGPARLNYRDQTIRLRRKGLALLYYLALEGPTRREQLAALLWENFQAMANLRVELHRLRQGLRAFGAPFAEGEDPLRLPHYLGLERSGAGACLDGLDDVSPEFQAWLEYQRARQDGNHHSAPERTALLDELSRRLEPPAVLVLRGPPGAGHKEFAQALAKRLGLPFSEGLNGATGKSLQYLLLPYPHDARAMSDALLLNQIQERRTAVWVLAGSSFGDEPSLVLQLRQALPARQLRYQHLPPLSWPEVRRSLKELPFQEAAALYLQSSGNQFYLNELLSMRTQFTEPLPVPQRVRSAFNVEAQRLSQDARLALERLSIHPGPLPLELIRALGAEAYLDELERCGWLLFENGAWLLDEPHRTLLYEGLQAGRRARYHELAAEAFARQQQCLAEAYHRQSAGLGDLAQREVAPPPPTPKLGRTLHRKLGVGRELELLDPELTGPGLSLEHGRIVWSRRSYGLPPAKVVWQLKRGRYLLRLRGRAYLDDPFSAHEAYPLRIELPGAGVAPVTLASRITSGPRASYSCRQAAQEISLPLNGEFDYWLAFASGPALQLSSAAARAIIEVEVSLYALAPATARQNALVPAYLLGELEVKGHAACFGGYVAFLGGLLGRFAEGGQLVASCYYRLPG